MHRNQLLTSTAAWYCLEWVAGNKWIEGFLFYRTK